MEWTVGIWWIGGRLGCVGERPLLLFVFRWQWVGIRFVEEFFYMVDGGERESMGG